MDASATTAVVRQHLIDPEICIRCNTCEETCPVDAITHDSRNYVVRADVCGACLACITPCPTGAIDNWRVVSSAQAYSVDEQLLWDVLPSGATSIAEEADTSSPAPTVEAGALAAVSQAFADNAPGATIPPAGAAHPQVNLYTQREPVTATVVGNFRVTDGDVESDTHHIVLDFGAKPFPVLEGQSIGVLPPGVDAQGRPHVARQYSLSSPRDGERRGYNNIALTVKRVTADHAGAPVRGICSNYICDLAKGDTVQVIGPFGNTFLMPDQPHANLLMICTGTGSAPMRAMTERRRRLRGGADGRLMLFFGARTARELPYFGPLMNLPRDFIDINLAFSRTPDAPKRYVQDLMRERSADVAALLASADTHVYVCGLKSMEEGVLDALSAVCERHGDDWNARWRELKAQGRLHFETY